MRMTAPGPLGARRAGRLPTPAFDPRVMDKLSGVSEPGSRYVLGPSPPDEAAATTHAVAIPRLRHEIP
jgi:hypothetical protein